MENPEKASEFSCWCNYCQNSKFCFFQLSNNFFQDTDIDNTVEHQVAFHYSEKELIGNITLCVQKKLLLYTGVPYFLSSRVQFKAFVCRIENVTKCMHFTVLIHALRLRFSLGMDTLIFQAPESPTHRKGRRRQPEWLRDPEDAPGTVHGVKVHSSSRERWKQLL